MSDPSPSIDDPITTSRGDAPALATQPEPIPPTHDDDLVDRKIPCINCRKSIQGWRPSEPCPNCGHLVRDSLAADETQFKARFNPALFSRAAICLAAAALTLASPIVLTIGLALLGTNAHGSLGPLNDLVDLIVGLLFASFTLAGVRAALKARKPTNPIAQPLALIATVAAFALLVANTFDLALRCARNAFSFEPHENVLLLAQTSQIISLAALLILLVAGGLWLAPLTHRPPFTKLHRWVGPLFTLALLFESLAAYSTLNWLRLGDANSPFHLLGDWYRWSSGLHTLAMAPLALLWFAAARISRKLILAQPTAPAAQTLAPPPRATIAQDLPCFACGYNLRALPDSALCPECGTPLSQTFASHNDLGTLNLHRIVRAALLFAASPVISLLFNLLPEDFRRHSLLGQSLFFPINALALAFLLAGAWTLATSAGKSWKTLPHWPAILIAAAILPNLLLELIYFILLAFPSLNPNISPNARLGIAETAIVLQYAAQLFVVILTWRLMQRLTKQRGQSPLLIVTHGSLAFATLGAFADFAYLFAADLDGLSGKFMNYPLYSFASSLRSFAVMLTRFSTYTPYVLVAYWILIAIAFHRLHQRYRRPQPTQPQQP